MGVWNDERLAYACLHDNLVTPFDAGCVNPASIDLKLGVSYRLPDPIWLTKGTTLSIGTGNESHIATLPTWGEERALPSQGLVLYPQQFILCCSFETVCIPVNAVAHLFSKSSTGRKGLEHLHAGLGDPGFNGQWTFEFHNVAPWPILLIPGERRMQMEIHDTTAPPARDYSQTGRYQNQQGATPAREAR